MEFLPIISLILIVTFAGWWWINLFLSWLNRKSSRETGWEKYLRSLYERYKSYPNEMIKVPDAVILAVKRRIQNSTDFYPLTCNPSAEIEVITLIHEQGSVALMLAVAPKRNEPEALWEIGVGSQEIAAMNGFAGLAPVEKISECRFIKLKET